MKLKEYFSNSNTDFWFLAESVIIATGALSIPTLGGSGYGYDVAKEYSLELLKSKSRFGSFYV